MIAIQTKKQNKLEHHKACIRKSKGQENITYNYNKHPKREFLLLADIRQAEKHVHATAAELYFCVGIREADRTARRWARLVCFE